MDNFVVLQVDPHQGKEGCWFLFLPWGTRWTPHSLMGEEDVLLFLLLENKGVYAIHHIDASYQREGDWMIFCDDTFSLVYGRRKRKLVQKAMETRILKGYI